MQERIPAVHRETVVRVRQAVTEPQQPDTEAPPDYYEEDYYYGDD